METLNMTLYLSKPSPGRLRERVYRRRLFRRFVRLIVRNRGPLMLLLNLGSFVFRVICWIRGLHAA